MTAFLKTLFGDRNTIVAVAIVMATELLLVSLGQAAAADLTIPVLVLGATAWLAHR